jgi:hypothetical protein
MTPADFAIIGSALIIVAVLSITHELDERRWRRESSEDDRAASTPAE